MALAENEEEVKRMAEKMKNIDIASWVLCTIGAVNWGLVGALNYNLVDSVLGAGGAAARMVYILVGLGGLYSVWHMISYMRQ
jgi:hypothetical protein